MSAAQTSAQYAPRRRWRLSPLQRRRLANFRTNRRGYWSFWIFVTLFGISLIAELVANDKPLLVSFQGELRTPVFTFYSDEDFGGDLGGPAQYATDPAVPCLIRTGGLGECLDARDPTAFAEEYVSRPDAENVGWILWAPIPWSFSTIDPQPQTFPAPPSSRHLFGTDNSGRDLLAIVIYGFRLSVTFGLIVTLASTVVGVLAGAAMGYFGGWIDLVFQRIVEIWTTIPALFVILIVSAIYAPNFWWLVFLISLFSWPALVGVVRAEFLRARNFEYVQAARALGLSSWSIIMRHVLPNALVATVTLLPFILTGSISTLAVLDLLGFGLPEESASLGQIGLEARENPRFYWLGIVAFFTFAIMLSLLVFVFEAVRDALDPRKTFQGELR